MGKLRDELESQLQKAAREKMQNEMQLADLERKKQVLDDIRFGEHRDGHERCTVYSVVVPDALVNRILREGGVEGGASASVTLLEAFVEEIREGLYRVFSEKAPSVIGADAARWWQDLHDHKLEQREGKFPPPPSEMTDKGSP